MSGKFLSSIELVDSFKDQHFFEISAKCGVKDNTVNSSYLEKQKLIEFTQHRYLVLLQECIKKKNKLALGNCSEYNGHVHLIKILGKFWQYMGYRIDGKEYLYPEEAMYLIQQGLLLVNNQGIIMSAEEAFFTLLDSYRLQLKYVLFSNLSAYGYILMNLRNLKINENIPKPNTQNNRSQKIIQNKIYKYKNSNCLNYNILEADISNQMHLAYESSIEYNLLNNDLCNFKNHIYNDTFCNNIQYDYNNLFKNIDINKLVDDYLMMNFESNRYNNFNLEIFDNDTLFKTNAIYNFINNLNFASIFIILHKTSKRLISLKPNLDISLLPPNINFSKEKYDFEFSFNVKDEYRETIISLEDIILNTQETKINSSPNNLLDIDNLDYDINLFTNCSINIYMLKNISNFEMNINKDLFSKIEDVLHNPILLNKIKNKILSRPVFFKRPISPLINHSILSATLMTDGCNSNIGNNEQLQMHFQKTYSNLNIINHVTQLQQIKNESNKHTKARKNRFDYNVYCPNKKFKKSSPGKPDSRIFVQCCSDAPPPYNKLNNLYYHQSEIENFYSNSNIDDGQSTKQNSDKKIEKINLESNKFNIESLDFQNKQFLDYEFKKQSNCHSTLEIAVLDNADTNLYQFKFGYIPFCT